MYLFLYVWGARVEVGEWEDHLRTARRVGFLRPSWGSQRLNSDCQAQKQVTLLTDPSSQPPPHLFIIS